MPAAAELAHDLPGRTRFRVPSRRRDAGYFERLETSFRSLTGVRAVHGNPVSGAVLVIHDLSADELARHAGEHGLFVLTNPASPTVAPLTREVAAWIDDADQRLRSATHGAVDTRELSFVLLACGAAFQAVRGNLLPASATLLMYAAARLERTRPDPSGTAGERGGADSR